MMHRYRQLSLVFKFQDGKKAIDDAANKKYLRRKIEHEDVKGIFFVRYEHHYVFFRELSKDTLGVVNVLHESMDIPNQLKGDLNTS